MPGYFDLTFCRPAFSDLLQWRFPGLWHPVRSVRWNNASRRRARTGITPVSPDNTILIIILYGGFVNIIVSYCRGFVPRSRGEICYEREEFCEDVLIFILIL